MLSTATVNLVGSSQRVFQIVSPQKMTLNYRHKTILGLLETFDGALSRIDFQKYLFLFTKEFESKPSFEFVPYKRGCFSFQSYADGRNLIRNNILLPDEKRLRLNDDYKNNFSNTESLKRFYKKYSHLRGNELIRYVYLNYPYYAINSEIVNDLLHGEELLNVQAARPKITEECFFTIGYEQSSFDGYLNRLIRNNINTLVDVRRNPISRKYGFSKMTLSITLQKLGINYVHMPQLGISSEKRQALETQDDYDRLFLSYEQNELRNNKTALADLFSLFKNRKRIAITCFEREVCQCHRGRVAKVLQEHPEWKYEVRHI